MIKRSATTALFLTALLANPAFALTIEEARQAVQPFYDFLSNAQDVEAAQAARDALDPQWQSFFSNTGSKGVDKTIKGITAVGKKVPDLKWQIKDMKVSGNTVVVRGEGSGTPTAEFFGVPHGGKSFRIMSIDLHTIKAGKIVKSYHVEDWAGALKQLGPSK